MTSVTQSGIIPYNSAGRDLRGPTGTARQEAHTPRPRADDDTNDLWLYPTAEAPSLTVDYTEPEFMGQLLDAHGDPIIDVYKTKTIGFCQ